MLNNFNLQYSKFYYCYSKIVSLVLGVPELYVISDEQMLGIEINRDSMSLSSKLFSITENFVNKYCDCIQLEDISNNLKLLDDGLYCLLTKSKNLKYFDFFVSHPDINHYVALQKTKNRYFIIDFVNNRTIHEEIDVEKFDFSYSNLYLIKEIRKKKSISCRVILNNYIQQEDYYKKYINLLDKASFSLDTAIDFSTSGLFPSRKAIIDLYLLEQKYDKLTEGILNDTLAKLSDIAERIKLLLVKLHFFNSPKDIKKLKQYIMDFKKNEDLLIKKIFEGVN